MTTEEFRQHENSHNVSFPRITYHSMKKIYTIGVFQKSLGKELTRFNFIGFSFEDAVSKLSKSQNGWMLADDDLEIKNLGEKEITENIMKKSNKALLEQIMKNVGKSYKKALNESVDEEIYDWVEEVDLFSHVWDAIGNGMTWDDWTCMGSIDKADFLYDALTELRRELGELPYTGEDLYEVYYDWVNSLEESDFENYDDDFILTEDDEDYLAEAFGNEDELDIMEAEGEPFELSNGIKIIFIDTDLRVVRELDNGDTEECYLGDILDSQDDFDELYELIDNNC